MTRFIFWKDIMTAGWRIGQKDETRNRKSNQETTTTIRLSSLFLTFLVISDPFLEYICIMNIYMYLEYIFI